MGIPERTKQFKSKGNEEDARRRRTDLTVELRKNKRDDQVAKRRNLLVQDEEQEVDEEAAENSPANMSSTMSVEYELPSLVAAVNSTDRNERFRGAQRIRQMLSKARHPPIAAVVKSGVIPTLVHHLRNFEHPELQFESAWALTNIASGNSDETRAVVDAGAVPMFMGLLNESKSPETREQASWALGNIAGDGPALRDLCVEKGIIPSLFQMLTECSDNLAIVRNSTWTISNLCRGKKPLPGKEATQMLVPALATLLSHTDNEVLTDALWAVSYVTDGGNDQIGYVISHGMLPRLCELIMHPVSSVRMPAMRACGNIVTGDDTQTQAAIDAGLLSYLLNVIVDKTSKDNLIKEASWTLSNILAGTQHQITQVLDANIIPPLLHVLASADFKSRKEAAWAICNAISGGSTDHLTYLVQQGCIKPLCDMMSCADPASIEVVLDGVKNLLAFGKKLPAENGNNPIATFIEQASGLDTLESLQSHPNDSIYHKALSIIETYFSEDESSTVDAQLVPQVDAYAQQYNFGTAPVSEGQALFSF